MNARRRSQRLTVIIIGLAVGIIFLNGMGWLPLGSFGRDILNPMGGRLTRAGQRIGSWLSEIGQTGTLREQNTRLSQDNVRLTQQLVEQRAVAEENRQLRTQLQFSSKTTLKLMGADVVGVSGGSIRQFLRINKGSRSGLRPGQAVVSAGKLVGSITQTSANTADVLLLSDEDFRVLAVAQTSNVQGIIKGQVGGGLVMERIPIGQKVKIGDTVITSGLDGQFPRGLLIGSVSKVGQQSEGIFQTAQITGNVDYKNLRVVMIVTESLSQ